VKAEWGFEKERGETKWERGERLRAACSVREMLKLRAPVKVDNGRVRFK